MHGTSTGLYKISPLLDTEDASEENSTYLVAGKDQGIGDHDILPSSGGEDDNLGNVVTSQWLDTPKATMSISEVSTCNLQLTCRQHQPWTCLRRSARQRTPITH